LAQHFLRQAAARYGRDVTGFHAEAMRALLAYSWPGNIRELSHAIERATLLAGDTLVSAADLTFRPANDTSGRIDDLSLDEVEKLLISKTIARFNGNVSLAANALGVSRSALYRRLQRYGL
jgi:DNA-binding NtrC family response regulator